MKLCDDGHGEVCYSGRDCPACELKGKLEDAEVDITDLKTQIDDLESRISG